MEEPLTLTTYVNGIQREWITIIENGIPVWTMKSQAGKHLLHENLRDAFAKALEEDDEPVIRILLAGGKHFDVNYFQAASLYLCEDLEGRYATLSTFCDAIWPLLAGDEVLSCQIL